MVNPRKKKVVLLPEAHAPGTPARSETQSMGEMEDDMRSVALDLGTRIAFCEVSDGTVVARATVTDFGALQRWLGPNTPKARVAIESCREVWWAERKLREWGHEPLVIDTTRSRKLGIGQHGRKTDRIDAETLARAVEARIIPRAHVLSEHRQQLRFQMGVRRALVETRAQYTTTVRGLARAHGVRLPSTSPHGFVAAVRASELDEALRREPVTALLKTTPGVATVVAAAFVSVVDDAKRFRRAHEVESYLGLVPSEDTSGKRRLGAITKKGNTYARALLIQAAWAILRSKGEDPLAQWGRAIALKRTRRVAIVAVARRLVGILWAMWRDGTVYEAARLGSAMAIGAEHQVQSAQVRAAALQRAARKSFYSSSARLRAPR
jgi:transposase